MENLNIRSKVISGIKQGRNLTEECKALRQEHDLSPTLFKIYLDEILNSRQQKCKLMGIQIENGNKSIRNLPFQNSEITGLEKCKYLGVLFNKDGNNDEKKMYRINKGRSLTRCLNYVLLEKHKRRIYRSKHGPEYYNIWRGNMGSKVET